MSHIFISYSRKDSPCVDKVVHYLEEDGFPVWIDRKKIELTSEFLQEITNNILQAKIFMLFWSANSQASPYVKAEMRIAVQQYLAGKLDILLIMLDKTDLPLEFAHLQAADFRSGCEDVTISDLVRRIPSHLRLFSYNKPLQQQPYDSVENTPFVSVSYSQSSSGRCKAYIVGAKNHTLPRAPRELAVCLQFMQPINKNMLKEVYISLETSDIWLLHITGPINKEKGTYWIDNNDRALWNECYEFITKTIQNNARSDTTVLKVFGLAAGVLLARVAMDFYRFWEVEFFNYTGDASKPYALTYHVGRNGSNV